MRRLPRERVYLAVPFAEKEEAKALGARWHHTSKVWFVPAGADPQLFARWILKEPVLVTGTPSDPPANSRKLCAERVSS